MTLFTRCKKIMVFFLFYTENHILEDVNKCVVALQEGDPDSLERTAGAIRGRAARSLTRLCSCTICMTTVVGLIPRQNEIFYIYFSFW